MAFAEYDSPKAYIIHYIVLHVLLIDTHQCWTCVHDIRLHFFLLPFQLTVIITDENDHPPIFDVSGYTLDLDENIDTGLIFAHIIATDGDSTSPNNVVTFSFGSLGSTYNS